MDKPKKGHKKNGQMRFFMASALQIWPQFSKLAMGNAAVHRNKNQCCHRLLGKNH